MKNRTAYGLFLGIFLISSSFAQPTLQDGKKLYEEGRLKEARAVFQHILSSQPHSGNANFYLGKIFHAEGGLDEAEEHMDIAVETDPKSIEYRLGLAAVYLSQLQDASFLSAPFIARKWHSELTTAHELDPTHVAARTRLIEYYLNAPAIGGGDKEKGMKMAAETIPLDEVQGRLLLASGYRLLDSVDLAMAEYDKVLALDPHNGGVHNQLGYYYLGKKDFPKAEDHFTKYIESAPNDPNVYDSMGDYYLARNSKGLAIASFQKAVVVEPLFSISRLKLAQTLVDQGDTSEAIRQLKLLLDLTPNHAAAEDAEDLLDDLD